MKIRNPTGREFPDAASGSKCVAGLVDDVVDVCVPRWVDNSVVDPLFAIFPSSKYFVSGIESARLRALNSRRAAEAISRSKQSEALEIDGRKSMQILGACKFSYL